MPDLIAPYFHGLPHFLVPRKSSLYNRHIEIVQFRMQLFVNDRYALYTCQPTVAEFDFYN